MKTIAAHVEDYLTLRRGLGFKLKVNGYLLRDFAKYCRRKNASRITTKMVLQWAALPDNIRPEQRGVRLGIVRVFARYLAAIDPRTEIPARGLLPLRKHRSVPGFYRDDQVVERSNQPQPSFRSMHSNASHARHSSACWR
jgi:integrase/recombinase XerD